VTPRSHPSSPAGGPPVEIDLVRFTGDPCDASINGFARRSARRLSATDETPSGSLCSPPQPRLPPP
jgi:hypothetical protein